MRIVVNASGKEFAESLQYLWGGSHDMRCYATQVAEDVWSFVQDLLDELDDPEADLVLRDLLEARHSSEEWESIRKEHAE